MAKDDDATKAARTKQWQVTLDDYHKFLVLKYKDALGVKKSEAMARMIEAWALEHRETAASLGASFEDWMRERGTWVHDDND